MKNKQILFLFVSVAMLLFTSNIVFASTYEYDALARLIKVDYNEDKGVGYSYDAGRNINRVTGFVGVSESTTESITETITETPTEDVSTKDYVWNYSDNENTENFFSVSANNWSNTVPVSYGDLNLTRAVKMESSSLISFNAPQMGKLTLVTYQ